MERKALENVKAIAKKSVDIAQKGVEKVDVDAIKQRAADATVALSDKASDIKEAAISAKNEINDKLTELDRMLSNSVTEYNDVYTLMNDKGVKLYVERCRSIDTIYFVENLINSIANKPKSFEIEFEEIETDRKQFTEACEFAERELQAARVAAGGAGAGLAAGASVVVITFIFSPLFLWCYIIIVSKNYILKTVTFRDMPFYSIKHSPTRCLWINKLIVRCIYTYITFSVCLQ